MKYTKRRPTYEQQLELMESRGLLCRDRAAALQRLSAIGYYRLSGYVYPFRELLPEDEQQNRSYRSDVIRPDVTFNDVVQLWEFDRRLRLLVMDAAETIEVALRTRVAYILSRRDPFGHLDPKALDERKCDRVKGRSTAFENWEENYERQRTKAQSEDYVAHHILTYRESEIPIWIACEFISFGALLDLFSLMRVDDTNEVARGLGFTSGGRLLAVLRPINYLRNTSAHHGRLWNRTLTLKPPHFHSTEVSADLEHVTKMTKGSNEKIYPTLAVCAHLVRLIDPTSRWPWNLRERVHKKFPKVPYLSPETDMGFPDGWYELPLWADPPRQGAQL